MKLWMQTEQHVLNILVKKIVLCPNKHFLTGLMKKKPIVDKTKTDKIIGKQYICV